MNLILDIGNSRVKVAVVAGDRVLDYAAKDDYDVEVVKNFVEKYDISRSIVSSTRGQQTEVVESVRKEVGHCLFFGADVAVPLRVSYATPRTLGRDRLAAAVGAREVFGEGDMLIVDFGTAITIDLVTREGGFEGGVISPGLALRFRALHEFTAALPMCSASDEQLEVARTTKDAIVQGVMNGVSYEIEGYISRFLQKYDKLSVIFVGGDAKFFEKRIKNTIFANRELLFRGLSRILDYNAE
ncbi:MAG: type III pantothenate kinase [Rikenellaceae bacterium]